MIARLNAWLVRPLFSIRSPSCNPARSSRRSPTSPLSPLVSESAANGRADGDGNELARVSAITLQNASSFSRGLVDTYFRQMGNAGALSREEVIALAKRIEASQRAMITGLCGVPM